MTRIHRSTLDALLDLERHGDLVRIQEEVDPHLEMAAIHRRVFERGGPAMFFERVKGSPFAAASNLFGTLPRARYLFRHTLDNVKAMIALRANPAQLLRSPGALLSAAMRMPATALHTLPARRRNGPVFFRTTTIDQLPAPVSWPLDAGPFITLPQVMSEDPDRPGVLGTNMGMYRVQLQGNDYIRNEQIGLHYQIHRGIGVHHAKQMEKGRPLRVSIFIGGPPAHTLAAVMPLPEGLPEVAFAGALAGRRPRYHRSSEGALILTEADFCITGTIEPALLPEGPFGDHLGYYSLKHDFPVVRVEKVYHRKDAVWPFTIVGRPPQEDTIFGELIHELTGPMVPVSLPGVKAIHAVDAAGVHPLLLALGSERYAPYSRESARPMELLTIANAILGFGQVSLAKYLLIAASSDGQAPDPHQVSDFLRYCLMRLDFSRDLHFQTQTTMDTLDYSGTGLNRGSRLVLACHGPVLRHLATSVPAHLAAFDHHGFGNVRLAFPGILCLSGPPSRKERNGDDADMPVLIRALDALWQSDAGTFADVALIVVTDDSAFAAATLSNLLWTTFTRSDPAEDVYGVAAHERARHWGCAGPVIVDARLKPFMAPQLKEDPDVERRIDRFFARNQPLARWA